MLKCTSSHRFSLTAWLSLLEKQQQRSSYALMLSAG